MRNRRAISGAIATAIAALSGAAIAARQRTRSAALEGRLRELSATLEERTSHLHALSAIKESRRRSFCSNALARGLCTEIVPITVSPARSGT